MYKYNWMQTLDSQQTSMVEYDFLMWTCFTDPPNGHKVCIMQLNNLYNHTFSIFLFNALKIRRNVQDVIINKMKLLNLERIVSCGISCLLIGIPIHSHEQNIMVKKEDESYNFQYVILVEHGVLKSSVYDMSIFYLLAYFNCNHFYH